MGLCLATAGVVKSLAVASFMLAWTHSVEKTEWQEEWRVTLQGLEIVEARVKGSGAGMEPPPDARLVDGWFRWKPQVPILPEVALGNSGMAGEWRLCTDGKCQTFSDILGQPAGAGVITMTACLDPSSAELYDNRGQSYARNNAYDKAIVDYNQAIRLKPTAKFYLNRGTAYQLKDDLDSALADYNRAIELDDKLALAYNNRGMVMRAKGNRPRALADFTTAVRLDPDLDVAVAHRKDLAREIERIGAQMPLKGKGK